MPFLEKTEIADFAFPNLASWNSYDHRRPDEPMVLATEWENDADPVPFVSNIVKKRAERCHLMMDIPIEIIKI